MINKINFFPVNKTKKNILYFYTPALLLILWISFSIISIFTVGIKNLGNPFIIFSILTRISISFIGLYFYKTIFLELNNSKTLYNVFKAFVGYGVVLTYVFYSLPRMVGEFNENISNGYAVFQFVLIVFITAFPAILYLFLRTDQLRMIFKFFSKKDLELEKKVKKDKNLKKKELTRIRSERSFLANLWYEWIDVIIQAILIALLIQQFIFQMYQIPSESMVPTFVERDRVLVNKAVYGPHIPLTKWKLPGLVKPKVGDIVVFINPEMDDPISDVKYNNVFSRIFHPFVFMLTLSIVDIDKKEDGRPKERFIVKRCIAKSGEKICIVNDKVYKRRKNSEWIMMKDIYNKDYAQVDLYYKNQPLMHNQMITPEIRSVLNKAQETIESKSIEELQNEISTEKQLFIKQLKSIDLNNFINTLYNRLNENQQKNYNYKLNFAKNNVNISYFKDQLNIQDEIERHPLLLQEYNYSILYNELENYVSFLTHSDNPLSYIENQINTVVINYKNNNPYNQYMKSTNITYKLLRLKYYNFIIDSYKKNNLNQLFFNSQIWSSQFAEYIDKLCSIYIYLNGIPMATMNNHIFDYNLFALRNFSEYPKEKDQYLKSDDYFLMGDNRYNSHDNRFNGFPEIPDSALNSVLLNEYREKTIFIDEDDTSDFSIKTEVNWVPRAVKEKYILGKAELIYYPVDRFKRLTR